MTIALELQQLKKTYPGGVQALRGIDLQVEAGDFMRFSGRTGPENRPLSVLSALW